MSEVSKNRPIVKGLSVFFLLYGLAGIAVAAIMFFGAPHVDLRMEDGTEIARMYAIILAVIGLVEVVAGILGIRAVKHHGLLKPYIYLVTFMIIVNIAVLGETLASGSGTPVWPYIIYIATALTADFAAARYQAEVQGK